MADRIIRTPNERIQDGFRVMQGKKEYVTYPEGSSFRCWYSVMPWRYENHSHSAVEIVLTEKGTVTYDVGGRRYDVKEGQVIIIPPEMDHALSMGEDSARSLYLFEPDPIFTMGDIKRLSGSFRKVFYLNDESPVHREVRSLLQKASETYKEQNLMWNSLCYSAMLQMYAALGQAYLSGAVLTGRNGERSMDSEIITGAMTYINNHYREDLNLDQVAEVAGFSRFYFSRSFKKHTGYSFKDYLCQKRLQVAMDLLIRTNMSMREVALESGFGSVATFNRVFRENKNCTPTQYRAIYGSY